MKLWLWNWTKIIAAKTSALGSSLLFQVAFIFLAWLYVCDCLAWLYVCDCLAWLYVCDFLAWL